MRGIAVGRRAWLFFGSDDHATAAANLLPLIASCELHGLDPETYLSEIIHLLPYWPRDRYLELAPKYWTGTRARIPVAQLDVEIGDITVPPPAPQEPVHYALTWRSRRRECVTQHGALRARGSRYVHGRDHETSTPCRARHEDATASGSDRWVGVDRPLLDFERLDVYRCAIEFAAVACPNHLTDAPWPC